MRAANRLAARREVVRWGALLRGLPAYRSTLLLAALSSRRGSAELRLKPTYVAAHRIVDFLRVTVCELHAGSNCNISKERQRRQQGPPAIPNIEPAKRVMQAFPDIRLNPLLHPHLDMPDVIALAA